jgi:sortase A
VKMKDGNVYTYQIRKRWITHAEDRTVIVPKKEPILTLTTCYPFDYVGNAPDRYIIQSELIEVRTPAANQRLK